MLETVVSVISSSPDELESELAMTTDPSGELRVNGVCLARLQPAEAEAMTAIWLMEGSDDTWSLVVHCCEQWQVLDIFWCLDHADLVERITPPGCNAWLELLVVPVGDRWVVIEADPTGEGELHLHHEQNGHAHWATRSEAVRVAKGHAVAAMAREAGFG